MRRRLFAFAAVLPVLMAGSIARADEVPTALVYAGLGGAPVPLERRVETSLRTALTARGVPVLSEAPAAANGTGGNPDARIAAARRDLERGIGAYRELALDVAVQALTAAEAAALAVPESPQAPGIAADARLHLALCALAMNKGGEVDRLFRRIVAADPERRLDARAFPPNVIGAFEAARKAVLALPLVELTLAVQPEEATVLLNGRPVSGPAVKVPPGEHLLAASIEGGSAGTRIEASGPRAAATLQVRSEPARLLAAFRAAARKGDEPAAARALDALGASLGAERILVWDLRSVNGRIEAPLRIRAAGGAGLSPRPVMADLGAAVSLDPPIRSSIAVLLEGGPRDRELPPIDRGRRRDRGGMAGWAWWAAGGLAVVAAGGAAAALAQPSPGGGRDTVSVTVEK